MTPPDDLLKPWYASGRGIFRRDAGFQLATIVATVNWQEDTARFVETLNRGEALAALESDRALLQEAQAEVLRVRDLINRDKTGLAQAIDEMVKEAQGRLWIVDGRGSYEWDDERYRNEAGIALRAIVALGNKALNDSGRLADAAFHPESETASDRALLGRIGDALNTWDAIAPTVLNAPTSLFVRTVRSIIDEARARTGEGK